MLCWRSKYSLSTTFYQDFASKYFRGTRFNSAISYQKYCTWKWMRCLKTLSCIPLFYLVELFECKCVCYYHFLSTDIKWINCVFLFFLDLWLYFGHCIFHPLLYILPPCQENQTDRGCLGRWQNKNLRLNILDKSRRGDGSWSTHCTWGSSFF